MDCKSSRFKNHVSRIFLRGGSPFDAWLTAATAQIAQVLLTLPHTFAQMGMMSGILFQLLHGALGCWSCYMTTCLYADYILLLEKQNSRQENHIVQLYEVLGGLLGKWWRAIGLLFNCTLLICGATIQLIACGDTVWYINDNLDKRSWTYIFGAVCFATVFIPDPRNYRLWAFVGIFMTTYTAWYVTIASLFFEEFEEHEKVKYTAPTSSLQYFTGATNIVFTFGGHGFTLEIVDAMDKPRKYKTVYAFAILYILTLTLPSAISAYWRFGDSLLYYPNVFGILSSSRFKHAAVVLMLAHQFIEFGAVIIPVFAMWEKLLGIHYSRNYFLKSLARMPIVMMICFLALMLPFFGAINSVVGAFLSSTAVYIVPCLAFVAAKRHTQTRENSVEQPPFWLWRSWVGIFAINLGVVLWVGIIGLGFGAWASTYNLLHNVEHFGLFARCYQCTKASKK